MKRVENLRARWFFIEKKIKRAGRLKFSGNLLTEGKWFFYFLLLIKSLKFIIIFWKYTVTIKFDVIIYINHILFHYARRFVSRQ